MWKLKLWIFFTPKIKVRFVGCCLCFDNGDKWNRENQLHRGVIQEQFTQGIQRMASTSSNFGNRHWGWKQEWLWPTCGWHGMCPQSCWISLVSLYWACRRKIETIGISCMSRLWEIPMEILQWMNIQFSSMNTFCLAVGHVMSIDSLIMRFGVRKYWSFNKSSQPLPIAHDWSLSFVESRLLPCKRFSIHNHKCQGFVWKSFSNSKAYLTNFGLKMVFLKMRRFFRPIFRCFSYEKHGKLVRNFWVISMKKMRKLFLMYEGKKSFVHPLYFCSQTTIMCTVFLKAAPRPKLPKTRVNIYHRDMSDSRA